jgi:hypothetical protein
VTLYGKIAAFSHYDVLKTTEPLTCSDGVRNFTCLLSKTDITPVLRELKKIDVAPEVSPAARRWVLVLDFNFTDGTWRWRNVTVLRGWELKWNNETVYVFQAPIKKSLGEMVKINKELSEAFFVRRELKNITAVAVYADKIAIGTSNGTIIDGKGKPDRKATEKIKNYIRKKYGDIIVEVYYTPGATPLIEMAGDYPEYKMMAGDYPVEVYYRSNGRYKYEKKVWCTLGYLGYLYGDPNLPVVITAWHCFGFVGTDRTSPFIANVTVYTPKCAPCRISSLNGFLRPGYYVWSVWPLGQFMLPALYVVSDFALIGVRDPNFFSNAGLEYGKVRRADGFRDLPIIGTLNKFDVKEGDTLWIRLGYSDRTVRGTVKSLCHSLPPRIEVFFEKGFVPVVLCHVALDITVPIHEGDSGSPVYVLEGRRGNVFVRAYGVVSAREGLCIPGTDYCIISRAIVAPIDWRNVKVS